MLRVALGSVVVIDLVLRARDMVAHYTDEGLLPRQSLLGLGWNQYWFSLHMGGGHWTHQALLFGVNAFFGVALALGYRTRLASLGCWVFALSLHARNPVILTSGDVLLRMLLFWGIFLPWGERWSLQPRPASPDRVLSAGTLGYVLQIVLLYQMAFIWKDAPEWRTEGTAVYYMLSLEQFATPLGTWLLQFPALLKVLTFTSLYLEGACLLILLCPLWRGPVRTTAVFAYLLLHLGIGCCIHIGIFTLVAACATLGLLPSWFWDRTTRPVTVDFRIPHLLAVLAALYVAWWNLADWRGWNMPKAPGYFFQFEQRWSMFAPTVLREDGWFVPEGRLGNGKSVDLHTREVVNWDKPAHLSSTFPNDRWRKWFLNLYNRDFAGYRQPYADYLRRRWNSEHRGPWQVREIRLWYMLETTLPEYQQPEVRKLMLGEYYYAE